MAAVQMADSTMYIITIVCRETHTNVWEETLQLHAVYKKLNFFFLQVMREFVSGTTSHVRCV